MCSELKTIHFASNCFHRRQLFLLCFMLLESRLERLEKNTGVAVNKKDVFI